MAPRTPIMFLSVSFSENHSQPMAAPIITLPAIVTGKMIKEDILPERTVIICCIKNAEPVPAIP